MYRNITVKILRSLIIPNEMKVVRIIRVKIKNIRTSSKKRFSYFNTNMLATVPAKRTDGFNLFLEHTLLIGRSDSL